MRHAGIGRTRHHVWQLQFVFYRSRQRTQRRLHHSSRTGSRVSCCCFFLECQQRLWRFWHWRLWRFWQKNKKKQVIPHSSSCSSGGTFFLMSHDISFVPSSIQHLFDILLRSLMFVCFCFFEIANYAQTEHATRRRFQVSAICRVDGRRSQCHVEDAGSQHFPMGLVQLQSLFHHRVSRVSHIRTTFSLYILYSSLLISFLYLIIWSGGYGECLLDKPSTDLLDAHRAAKKLPGENFDENKQCELVFGHGSKICPYMVNIMIVI